MAQNTGRHHKDSAADGQDGQDKASQDGFVLLLADPLDEDGDIHGVDGDDGQLAGIEDKGALPGAGQIGQIEIQAPEAAHQQADHGGIVGHIGLGVHLREDLRPGAFLAGGQRIEAADAAQHQAVHGAQAGDGHEQVQDIAEHIAEDIQEGHGSALADQLVVGSAAGHADIIEQIGGDDDQSADDQRLGQIPLGILQLGIDGGCDDPALIGKGRCAHCREQRVADDLIAQRRIGKVAGQLTGGQAVDDAHNGHQRQRDELDDGGGGLQLACQLGRKGVYRIAAAQIEQHQRNTFRPDHAAALLRRDHQRQAGIDGGQEDQGIAGREPGQNGGQRGIINGGHEPAHQIAVFRTHGGLGIVHDPVDLFIFLGHIGKGQNAHQHDHAADEPGQNAQRHISAGFFQDDLGLKKDAGADYDADHHANRGKQAVFSFQFVVHTDPSFVVTNFS